MWFLRSVSQLGVEPRGLTLRDVKKFGLLGFRSGIFCKIFLDFAGGGDKKEPFLWFYMENFLSNIVTGVINDNFSVFDIFNQIYLFEN